MLICQGDSPGTDIFPAVLLLFSEQPDQVFQPGDPKLAERATPQYYSYLQLGSWLQTRALKPQQQHNLQHRSPCTVQVHTKHTPPPNSSLLTQLPSGMPQKKEFQPNWDSLLLLAFRALLGKGSSPSLACWIHLTPPSSPPLWNYN